MICPVEVILANRSIKFGPIQLFNTSLVIWHWCNLSLVS